MDKKNEFIITADTVLSTSVSRKKKDYIDGELLIVTKNNFHIVIVEVAQINFS